jgi:hypothetical protein
VAAKFVADEVPDDRSFVDGVRAEKRVADAAARWPARYVLPADSTIITVFPRLAGLFWGTARP